MGDAHFQLWAAFTDGLVSIGWIELTQVMHG